MESRFSKVAPDRELWESPGPTRNAMNAIDLLLLQFDHAWSHAWESIQHALKGVTPAEASFQATCYAKEAKEADFPPPGTILWQLHHLHWCSQHYANVLRLRPQKEIADPPKPPLMTLDQAVAALHESHGALRAEVARLQESDLQSPCNTRGERVAEFVSACLRHAVWHASQIALARRLYREAAALPR